MTLTARALSALEDAIYIAIEDDATRKEIEHEFDYLLDLAEEEGDL